MRLFVLTCLIGLVVSRIGLASEFNEVLDIGDQAPVWNQLVGVDGAKHSSDELADKKAVVVAFTCNSCPYAVDAEDRLIAITKRFADQGVAVVAINVNKIDADGLPAMKEKATAKSFPFAYLFDPTQQIAKDFGAGTTPQFFVLDGKRQIRYLGALDDSPDGKSVTRTYVIDAVEAVLAGETPKTEETVPIGCRIRFERERRTRKAD